MYEAEVGKRLKLAQRGQLRARIVVVVEFVHANHGGVVLEQQFRDVHADRTRRAGN